MTAAIKFLLKFEIKLLLLRSATLISSKPVMSCLTLQIGREKISCHIRGKRRKETDPNTEKKINIKKALNFENAFKIAFVMIKSIHYNGVKL